MAEYRDNPDENSQLHEDPRELERSSERIMMKRLVYVVLPSVLVLVSLFILIEYISASQLNVVLFNVSFLVIVPFVSMLILGTFYRRYWGRSKHSQPLIYVGLVVLTTLIVVSSPVLICLIIAMPYILIGGLLGLVASKFMLRATGKELVATIIGIALFLPFAIWSETNVFFNKNTYVVERSVLVNASPESVWPHLLRIDDIQGDEGGWNFSQNVLQVPRPVEAIVEGEGIGAIRTGIWKRGVWFEEHITDWKLNDQIEWKFVFPEGSRITAVDQHIDPRGPTVVVENGGYSLKRISPEQTELVLHTRFTVNTSINRYGRLWGEILLGDVQNNILSIVQKRAESSSEEIQQEKGPLLAASSAKE